MLADRLYKEAVSRAPFRQGEEAFRMFLFDQDGTFTHDETDPSDEELAARLYNRSCAEKAGLLGFMSGRSAELMMTNTDLEKSQALGFERPAPRIGRREDATLYVLPMERSRGHIHALSPAFMFSWGLGIFIRQKDGGYLPDQDYAKQIAQTSGWRDRVMRLLESFDRQGNIFDFLAPIESWQNWRGGKTNVPPLAYRIQFHFRGKSGAFGKARLKRFLKEDLRGGGPASGDMRLVHEIDPKGDRDIFYLVPKSGTKDAAIAHLVNAIRRACAPAPLKLCMAGDRITDFNAALSVKADIDATFLAIGECLTPPFWRSRRTLARTHNGWQQFAKPLKQPGFYSYVRRGRNSCTIIIAKEAYPEAQTGPDAIKEFLSSPFGKELRGAGS